MTNVIDRYKKHRTLYEENESSLEELLDDRQEQKETLQELHDQSDLLDKSTETIKTLIDTYFHEKIEAFEELIQDGLNKIFVDRDYQFRVNLGSRGSKKTATFEYSSGDLPWQKMDGSCGGSVRVIVDLVCRAYLIAQMDRKRFLMMDEALSELSDAYIEPCVSFLDGLSEKLDFDILLVTHDDRISSYIDNSFHLENGKRV